MVSAVVIPQLPFFDPSDEGRAPVGMDAIDAAAASLGVKFPAAFVELLRDEGDGGRLLKSVIATTPPVASHGDSFLSVSSIFGVGGDSGIENAQWLIDAWGVEGDEAASLSFKREDVVLFAQEGHDHYLFHYLQGRDAEPEIVYCYVDAEIEVARLASDFQEFLDRLVVKGDVFPTWVTGPELDLDAVVERLLSLAWAPEDGLQGNESVKLKHPGSAQTVTAYSNGKSLRIAPYLGAGIGVLLAVDTGKDGVALDDSVRHALDEVGSRITQ